MDPLKRLKENTVWPNVFTTGIPRTYSTASLDISSKAFWYSSIFFFILAPVILIIIKNPSTTGTRLNKPKRQSNRNNNASKPIGVAIAPALSGSWCAKYVSVAALDSFTILRSLPLPNVSAKPRGSFTIWCIASIRILAAIRNAAKCEHISRPIYSKIDNTENNTAIQPL